MVFSGASAFAMSYASAWCVRVTSSTTYSMVGALNKLPIAASGIMFFGDPATIANVTAIIVGKVLWKGRGGSNGRGIIYINILHIGFIAGLVYSVAKTLANKQPQPKAEAIPMSSSSQSASDAVKDHGKP
jgi:GDP-mannose transporter